jgi:hypothetical protein
MLFPYYEKVFKMKKQQKSTKVWQSKAHEPEVVRTHVFLYAPWTKNGFYILNDCKKKY